MKSSTLIRSEWLVREIEFTLPDGTHTLEYDGRGWGFEKITVNGEVILKTSLYWYVPCFEFEALGLPGTVEVRVWPWLQLRSLVVRVGKMIVYAEGVDFPKETIDWDGVA